MFPIKLNSTEQFDQESFINLLLDICKEHKTKRRALAFAFLVYDFEDNTIQEILEHTKYWSTLDKVSGRFLTIFYINSNDEYFHERQREIQIEESIRQQRSAPEGMISYLQPIPPRNTPLEDTIDFLRKTFGTDCYLNHPFIIFFQTDGEYIIDSFVLELKKEKLEDAFLELKNQIKNTVEALSQVKPQYYNNHQEIFNLIRNGVIGGKYLNFIKTKIISKIKISAIVAFVKIILGHLH